MISAIAGASAVCCFAASYVAHQILPVTPIVQEGGNKLAGEPAKVEDQSLKKALESQHTSLKRENPQISVSIVRSDSPKLLAQSQAGLSV